MNKVIEYAQTHFYLFWFNSRKINAMIKRSQIHRIKVYIMLFAILVSCINNVFAIENIQLPYGQKEIYYRVDDKSYIIYNNIPQLNTEYFYMENDKEHIAYCIDLGLKGAEYSQDGHYAVGAVSKIESTDKVLNDILLNCYPYKSVEELKVATVDEAIFASQFAIWCYTSPLDLNLMRPTTEEYTRVDSCIRNIYNAGVNGIDSNITIDNNVSKQQIEEIDGEKFYTKEIELTNIKNINSVKIKAENNVIKLIENGNIYKVCAPVDYVDNNGGLSFQLKLDMNAKENAVLLGTSYDKYFQRVAVTVDNNFNYNQKMDIYFESIKSRIKVKKVDEETKDPLKGVKYSVSYENGDLIGKYTTDENGEFEIILQNEEKCVINIVEEQELEYYIKDYGVHKVEVSVRENKQVTLYNKKKKGYIEIIKKTKEYNELTGIEENEPLSNVSFYIYDKDGNLIDDVTTDKNGKAQSQFFNCGKYYIKEYKTQEGYKLLDEIVEVEISFPGEKVQLNILNENVEIPKELPVTGR